MGAISNKSGGNADVEWMPPSRGGLSPRNHRSIIKGKAFIMATACLQTALLDPSCGGCNY